MRNKISLVLAGLLGSGLLVADEVNTQAPSEAKKTLSGFFDGMEAKGFAFARYTTIDGRAGTGADQQYRMKLDLTSGKVEGWSFTGGIMFNYGGSNPTATSSTNYGAQGSMAVVQGKNFNDRFGVATFSVNKEIVTQNTTTTFNFGRLNIDNVFADKTTDLGTGGKARFKTSSGITYGADYFDSWITSHVIYNMRRSDINPGGTNDSAANGSLGNDLIMLSIKGDKVGGSGFSFNVAAGHANRLLDYLAFVDAKYDFGGFYVLGQVSAAGMTSNPNFMMGSSGNASRTVTGATWGSGGAIGQPGNHYNGFASQDWASSRGIYNIQIGYKSKEAPISGKLGYIGSFGDGYGTLLDVKGGLDMAGKFWNNNYDATNEGFGFMGAGGRKGTNIQVVYLALNLALGKSWNLGLDYSRISGDNNYPFVSSVISNAASSAALAGKGITFHEVAPSLTYKPIKNVTAVAMYGRNFGDVNYGKARFEIRYDF